MLWDTDRLNKPLCVDLDGTLVVTDTLVESFFEVVRRRPFFAFHLIRSLGQGRAGFKYAVAAHTRIKPESLPFNPAVLDFLEKERAEGRPLWLVTASHQWMAGQVADHLGIFDGVLSSSGGTNLAGKVKRAVLVDKFGSKGYIYMGNSPVDLHVWKDSDGALIVNPSNGLVKQAAKVAKVERVIETRLPLPLSVIKLLRPHQWLKNLLVFAPLVLAHHLSDLHALWLTVVAAFSFSLCSSAVYVMNDAVDIEADRNHKTKRRRPIASGAISLPGALFLFLLLLALSAASASFLPAAFAAMIGGYVTLNTAYSLWLKKVVLVDVFALSFMYIIRVFAGAAAGNVPVSDWFLSFCLFFFLGLALLKRVGELRALGDVSGEGPERRGYCVDDWDQLARFGVTSSYLSVLVLALYIKSPAVAVLYSHPRGLWLLCPLILFWISRMWINAHRGKITQDPVLFASRDIFSYLIGFAVLIVLYFSA